MAKIRFFHLILVILDYFKQYFFNKYSTLVNKNNISFPNRQMSNGKNLKINNLYKHPKSTKKTTDYSTLT